MRTKCEGLTDRQREVLRHLAHGKLNKEIAYMMGCTEGTVKSHLLIVCNVYRAAGGKFGSPNRVTLAMWYLYMIHPEEREEIIRSVIKAA